MNANANAKEMRAQWESTRERTRRLAVGFGIAAFTLIVVLALLWRLSAGAALASVAFGALGWALLAAAFAALEERLKGAELPAFLRRSRVGLLVALLLVVLLGLAGVLQIHGIWPPIALGAVTWLALDQARRARELAKPRYFVEIRHDGQARVLTVFEGQKLLDALEEAGYKLLTQCGRKGQCATCRVRAREGGPWGEKQYGPYLTPRQRQQGFVLACQVDVRQDLVIELFKPLVLRWPHVDVTKLGEKARRLRRTLPGFDCELCGHFTCDLYAQAIADGQEPLTKCLPGGEPVRQRLEAVAKALKLPTAPPTRAERPTHAAGARPDHNLSSEGEG